MPVWDIYGVYLAKVWFQTRCNKTLTGMNRKAVPGGELQAIQP